MSSTAPKWFRIAISDGLTRLIALSLQRQPSHETITLTKEAWIEVLFTGREWIEPDAARIAAAFRALSRRIDSWPAPRALLEHLPPRPESAQPPSRPLSSDQRDKNRRRASEMLRDLRRRMRVR